MSESNADFIKRARASKHGNAFVFLPEALDRLAEAEALTQEYAKAQTRHLAENKRLRGEVRRLQKHIARENTAAGVRFYD